MDIKNDRQRGNTVSTGSSNNNSAEIQIDRKVDRYIDRKVDRYIDRKVDRYIDTQ